MAECTTALVYVFDTRQELAKAKFDTAIKALERDQVTHSPALTYCLNARARLHYEREEHDLSVADVRRAILNLGSARPGQLTARIELQDRLGSAFGAAGRFDEAEHEYRSALLELRALNRESTPTGANIWNNLGTVRVLAGQPKLALDAFENAYRISQSIEGVANAAIASSFASALADTGELTRALALLTTALATAEKQKLYDSAGLIALRTAAVYCEMTNFRKCESVLSTAQAHLVLGYPKDDYVFSSVELLRAHAARLQGDFRSALAPAAAAVAGYDVANAPIVVRIRAAAQLAEIQANLGNVTQAEETISKLTTLVKQYAPTSARSKVVAEAMLAQGTVLAAQQKRAQALETVLRAREILVVAVGDHAPSTRRANTLLATLQ